MSRWSEEMPKWKAKGVKPSDKYIEEGWQAGQRPPYEWFNWLFNKNYRSQKELRNKIDLILDHIRRPRQIIKIDKEEGEEETFPVPGGSERIIDVYKIAEGDSEVQVVRDFGMHDEHNFDYNEDVVEFTDEEAKLKTDYTFDLDHKKSDGDGDIYEIDLNLSDFKKIESIKLN